MARIPLSDQSAPTFTGLSQFVAQPAPSQAPQRVSALLGKLRQRMWEDREAQANEAVARRAITQQRNSDELVNEEPGLASRYQRVFREQAESVYSSRVLAEAQQANDEIAARNVNDPQAYAQEWDAYMQGQLKGMEDARPELQLGVEDSLNKYGMQQQAKLQEALAARAKAASTLDFSRQMQEFETGAARALLNNPDEENLYGAYNAIEQQVTAAVANGMLTPAQGNSQILKSRERLTRQYATGEFANALRRGDIGGARGVIASLKAGRWFDDLDDGRRLADSLASDLKSRLDGVAGARARGAADALDYLGRLENASRLGQPVDMQSPDAQQAINLVATKGTSRQRQRLIQVMNGAAAYEQIKPYVETATGEELEALKGSLIARSTEYGGVSETTVNDLVSTIDARQKAIANARVSGDPMALVNLPPDASPEERRQAQAVAGRAVGLPADQVFPYSDAELDTYSSEYKQAVQQGDTARADALMTDFFAVAGTNPARRQGLAARVADPDFRTAIALSTAATPQVSADLMGLAQRGRELDASTQAQVGGLDQRDLERLELLPMADALSSGDTEVRSNVSTTLLQAYKALAADGIAAGKSQNAARKDAAAELRRMTASMRDTVQFTNGARMPRQTLADSPVGAEQLRRAIDVELETNPALEPLRMDSTAFSRVTPVPLADGSFGLVNRTAPRSLLLGTDGQPIQINRAEVEAQAAADEAERAAAGPGLVDRALGAIGSWVHTNRATSLVQSSEAVAATVRGADPKLVSAVALASTETPDEQSGWRQRDFLLSEDLARSVASKAEYRTAFKKANLLSNSGRVGQRVEADPDADPYTNVTGAQVAAAIALRDLKQKYGDLDQALAAYWVGPEAMDALGDDWRTDVPAEAMQFVERVKAQYAD